MKKWMYSLIYVLFFTGCLAVKKNTSGIMVTEELMLGEWYGGPGIKYNYYEEGIVEQPLRAEYALMLYKKDGTLWHDGHKKTMTWEMKGNDTILYDSNTRFERWYLIEQFNKDSMQVYGPFKSDGERYDKSFLFRLTQYRKKQ